MARALVTGSAGFIGRHMVAELKDRGYEVTGVDIRPANFGWLADMVTWLHGDRSVYDLIVHAAARSPHRAAIDGDPGIHSYNTMLDSSLFDWAISTGQRRVLYLSSCAVLDGPDDYGWTKLNGERMARQARAAGVPVTVVRPFSGYGADQGTDWPFGAFLDRAKRHEDPFVVWGDGNQVRDWIHVDDVVLGALAVVESGTEEPVSLCTGIGTSMVDLAEMVCRAAGYSPAIKPLSDKPSGVPYRVGDPSLLQKYYTPTVSLEEGIQRALR